MKCKCGKDISNLEPLDIDNIPEDGFKCVECYLKNKN
jgi:hypothetical protein